MNDKYEIKELGALLKTIIGGEVNVIDYNTEPLTEPGENYGSVMLAVKVNVNDKELSLVAKLPPPNPFIRKVFDSPSTFKKEIGFYEIVVPTLQQFQKENGLEPMQIFPKFYGGRTCLDFNDDTFDENAAILLENVKDLGYVMGNRFDSFDYQTAESILSNLALFHATPIALKLKQPQVFEDKIKPYLKQMERFKFDEELSNSMLKQMVDTIESNVELRQFSQRFRKKIEENLKTMNEPFYKSEPFATICHCDFWVNNVLLKHDQNGKVVHNVMVDFQLTEYASPGHDVVFFLHSSVKQEVLNKHYEDLLKIYYSKFIETLEQFHCNLTPFSYDNFMEELKMSANQYQFFHVFLMYKPIFLEKGGSDKEPSPKTFLSMDHLNDKYYDRCYALVRDFVRRNWI